MGTSRPGRTQAKAWGGVPAHSLPLQGQDTATSSSAFAGYLKQRPAPKQEAAHLSGTGSSTFLCLLFPPPICSPEDRQAWITLSLLSRKQAQPPPFQRSFQQHRGRDTSSKHTKPPQNRRSQDSLNSHAPCTPGCAIPRRRLKPGKAELLLLAGNSLISPGWS